ncbi:MAG: hypothetical protein A3F67_09780 [Verrucomicrobia bacterium RIFCSPHIGHO2_12_FULL_41_10]|nr:MAG: hypothetical protein A3F67_09780 [Verrucomicrobia bacterium RIFCSPHIGHO2_12_FULL_41_10]
MASWYTLHISIITQEITSMHRTEISTIFPKLEDVAGKSEFILFAAFLKEKTLYQQQANHFAQLIDHPDNSNLRCWMLGRLLLAAHLLDDVDRVEKAYGELIKITSSDQNIFSLPALCAGWGIGYRACYEGLIHHAHYDVTKKLLMQIVTDQLILAQTDRVHINLFAWTITMAIQAAGFSHDGELYQIMLENFKQLQPMKNIAETLQLINATYPLWMRTILVNTANIFSDTETVSLLENTEQHFYQDADITLLAKKLRDEPLAEATQNYYGHFQALQMHRN